MLRKEGFKGVMIKHNYGVTRDNVFVNIAVKHTSNHPNQYFLESFENEAKMTNIHSLFESPIEWDNLKLKLDDYPFFYEVEFDKIVFVARLMSISIVKKIKAGISSFEYTLAFRKDVEGDNKDSITAKTYLKYKEENEDGKKVLVEFDVILKPTDAPASMDSDRPEPTKVKDELVF
jgi:hypothetical protein